MTSKAAPARRAVGHGAGLAGARRRGRRRAARRAARRLRVRVHGGRGRRSASPACSSCAALGSWSAPARSARPSIARPVVSPPIATDARHARARASTPHLTPSPPRRRRRRRFCVPPPAEAESFETVSKLEPTALSIFVSCFCTCAAGARWPLPGSVGSARDEDAGDRGAARSRRARARAAGQDLGKGAPRGRAAQTTARSL